MFSEENVSGLSNTGRPCISLLLQNLLGRAKESLVYILAFRSPGLPETVDIAKVHHNLPYR